MPDVVRANGVSEHGNFYVFTVRKLQFLAVFCRQIYITSVKQFVRASGASELEIFSIFSFLTLFSCTIFCRYFLTCIFNVGHIVTVDDFPCFVHVMIAYKAS